MTINAITAPGGAGGGVSCGGPHEAPVWFKGPQSVASVAVVVPHQFDYDERAPVRKHAVSDYTRTVTLRTNVVDLDQID